MLDTDFASDGLVVLAELGIQMKLWAGFGFRVAALVAVAGLVAATVALSVVTAPAALAQATVPWNQVGVDIDGAAPNDAFGETVSLSADGRTLAIGGSGNDDAGNYSGHVRVYRLDAAGSWVQLGADIDGEAPMDHSGTAVSLSADGEIVAIGAWENDGGGSGSGHVRVYQLDAAGSWVQLGADIDGEASHDNLGRSVSLSADGMTVAIGASGNDGGAPGINFGHVRVYRLDAAGTSWVQLGADIDGAFPSDESGRSVSLSADGETVAIGAARNDSVGNDSGHVRVYRLDAVGSWVQLGADINGAAAGDFSGWAVSLSADGETVAIGAPQILNFGNPGQVRVFRLDAAGASWVQLGADIDGEAAFDRFGRSVSLSADGETVAIGASGNDGGGSDSGRVRVYQLDGAGSWVQLGVDIDGDAPDDESGEAVSLSADGLTVAIGAPQDLVGGPGQVRVFSFVPTVVDSASTLEDTTVSIDVVANDGPIGSATVATGSLSSPINGGSVAIDAATGEVVYTPAADYNGPDSFTYRATNGLVESADTTVTVTVSAVDDPPVGVADVNLPVVEDTVTNLDVLVNDTDTDTSAAGLSVAVGSLSSPVNGGSVAVDAVTGEVVYTPVLNYNGPDSFTYQVFDGISLSAVTSVSVVVSAVNDAPVGVADVNLAVAEDTATNLGVLVNDTDVDTPASGLSVDPASLTAPVNGGSVAVDAATGDVVYTPALNYVGADSFTYQVSDGSLLSAVTNVSVVVSAVDDPPVGVADVNLAVVEDTATNLAVLGNDTDTDTPAAGLSVSVGSLSSPVNGGSVAVDAVTGEVVYTPALNYSGPDSFTYQVFDGTSLSSATAVSVIVSAVNDAPVGVVDTVATVEDTPIAISVLANDSDVETANAALSVDTASLSSPVNGGSVAVDAATGDVVYTPALNYVGPDSFTYRVSDGVLLSAVTMVTVTVSAVDDAPVGVADPASTVEDAAVTVNVLGNDTDSDTVAAGLTVLAGSVSTPGNGTATVVAGGVEYTPNADFFGTDSFTYQVFDGTTASAAATVTVTVSPVDDAPVGVADAASTLEDTPVTLTLVANDTDIDTPTSGLSVAPGSLTTPANGSVVMVAGGVEFTPNPNFFGTDTFDYQVTDGTSTGAATTVTITIAPVLDAPVVVGDSTAIPVTGVGAVNLNVLANDAAVGGDPIDAVTATSGAQGTTVVNADLSITYTPGVMSSTTDTFTYTVCSGTACATGTVTLTFAAPLCQGVAATIWGTAANNVIVGTAGNDVIVGDAGNDVINAGLGDDLICGDAGDDRIDAGDGNDSVYGDDGNDVIAAGAGNDLVIAGAGNDDVTANAGNDRVRGQQGQDIIDGGPGNDFLYGGTGGDTITGGDGDDTIGGFGGADSINAGDGNDRVWGGFGADIIDGDGGDDVINGLIGNDLIRGGDGDDDLRGDQGQDRIFGDDGNDLIRGGNSVDTLNGNAGDDDLRGGKSNDDLIGGPGTDTCTGNTGTDTAAPTCETTIGVP